MILLGNREVDLLNDIFAGNPPDMEALQRVHELVSRDYRTRNLPPPSEHSDPS